jgi:hypothetical protein
MSKVLWIIAFITACIVFMFGIAAVIEYSFPLAILFLVSLAVLDRSARLT